MTFQNASYFSLEIKKLHRKFFLGFGLSKVLGLHMGSPGMSTAAHHWSQQRENSCASRFVQLLQEAYLIFPAKPVCRNCCIEKADLFLSRKRRMLAFSKSWVSRVLHTKDLKLWKCIRYILSVLIIVKHT